MFEKMLIYLILTYAPILLIIQYMSAENYNILMLPTLLTYSLATLIFFTKFEIKR